MTVLEPVSAAATGVDVGLATLIGVVVGALISVGTTMLSAWLSRRTAARTELREAIAEFLDALSRSSPHSHPDAASYLAAYAAIGVGAQKVALLLPDKTLNLRVLMGGVMRSLSKADEVNRAAIINGLSHVVVEWYAGRIEDADCLTEFEKVARSTLRDVGPQ